MQTAIRWFANNSVAANLLMIVLVLGGISGALTTNQEEFPNFDVKVINVFVPYLGAAPIEAEKAVCVRIEEAIEGVEGIEKVYGTAVEGGCSYPSCTAMRTTSRPAMRSRAASIRSTIYPSKPKSRMFRKWLLPAVLFKSLYSATPQNAS